MFSALHFALASAALYVTCFAALSLANGLFAFRAWCAWHRSRGSDAASAVRGSSPAISGADVARARAILVCGGEACRDELGARLAMSLDTEAAFLFLSSGHYKLLRDFDAQAPDNPHRTKFEGVDFARLQRRLVCDRSAIDTLANFTSFVAELARRGSDGAYMSDPLERTSAGALDIAVVTSAYHVPRALCIAAVVLSARGLCFAFAEAAPANTLDPSVQRERRDETTMRCVRDLVRAVVWVLTGYTGDGIATLFHRERRDFRARYNAGRTGMQGHL